MAALQRRLPTLLVVVLYVCAALQFIRYYVRNTTLYLNMPAYLSGHERLPFQERLLPVYILKGLAHFPTAMALLNQRRNFAWIGNNGAFFLLSFVSFAAAAVLTQLLYQRVSARKTLGFLVFPILLYVTLWTYVLHNEANFSYPYDLLSLAFFTAGLYCIFERRFALLLLVILVGTANRETTLFLIGIYLLDALGRSAELQGNRLSGTFASSLRELPWMRAGMLFAVWLAVHVPITYVYRHNDASENFVRFRYNAGLFTVRMIPALLNICGFLFPVVLLFWKRIQPRRFALYGWICLIWFPIMFYTGVLVETRIYGELCSWTAVAAVLLAEEQVARAPNLAKTDGVADRFEAEAVELAPLST